MKSLVLKLVFPAYVLAMAFLGWTGVQSHLDARTILADYSVVNAPMELIDASSRTRRGHTSITYNFRYRYTVLGTDYAGRYSAVNEKGERYVHNPFMEIAYSNVDPARAGALQSLLRMSKLGGLIKRLLIAAGIVGFITLLIFGWAMPDEDEHAEEAAART